MKKIKVIFKMEATKGAYFQRRNRRGRKECLPIFSLKEGFLSAYRIYLKKNRKLFPFCYKITVILPYS